MAGLAGNYSGSRSSESGAHLVVKVCTLIPASRSTLTPSGKSREGFAHFNNDGNTSAKISRSTTQNGHIGIATHISCRQNCLPLKHKNNAKGDFVANMQLCSRAVPWGFSAPAGRKRLEKTLRATTAASVQQPTGSSIHFSAKMFMPIQKSSFQTKKTNKLILGL